MNRIYNMEQSTYNSNYHSILGGIPPNTGQGQSVLIIDGAYLHLGARELERSTSRRLNLCTEEAIATLISYIRERTGGLVLS